MLRYFKPYKNYYGIKHQFVNYLKESFCLSSSTISPLLFPLRCHWGKDTTETVRAFLTDCMNGLCIKEVIDTMFFLLHTGNTLYYWIWNLCFFSFFFGHKRARF